MSSRFFPQLSRDANEKPIVDAFRAMGCHVVRISSRGAPDLIVDYRGALRWVEVKSEAGELTKHQVSFFREARERGTLIAIVRSVKDVAELVQEWGRK